jgi:hypothetical protein
MSASLLLGGAMALAMSLNTSLPGLFCILFFQGLGLGE